MSYNAALIRACCFSRRLFALIILAFSSCLILRVLYSVTDSESIFSVRRPSINSPAEWDHGDIGNFPEDGPISALPISESVPASAPVPISTPALDLFPTKGLLPPQKLVQKLVWTKVSIVDLNDTWSITEPQIIFLPPTYPQYFDHEMNVSMQNTEKYPRTKYLNFANFSWRSGFGNIMQEFLLHCIFTFDIGRTPVYNPYTWSNDPREDFSDYNRHLIPSRIPMSVMLAGPVTGGPLPSDRALAISRTAFDKICEGRKRVIAIDHFTPPIDTWADGQILYDTWAKHISFIDDECLEIQEGTPTPFDLWFFGTKRMHSMMDTYLNSPILQYFSFSPLIHAAYNNNMKLFMPTTECDGFPCSAKRSLPDTTPNSFDTTHLPSPHSTSTPSNLSPPWKNMKSIPGLLVLHLRRGDYLQHCTSLANWNSDFQGINSMLMNKYSNVSHPDEFLVPTEGGNGESTPENHAMYKRRCLPSIIAIVNKVREIRASYEECYRPESTGKTLSSIYIMTNGKDPWLSSLKQNLLDDSDDFLEVHSSRELELRHEEKYVAQTVDMLIGARADVFIGNGFSSMTSNVVMLRMARGTDPLDTRFW